MTKVKESAKVDKVNSAKRLTLTEKLQQGLELSPYELSVLLPNKRLRQIRTSLGGCRSEVVHNAAEMNVTPLQLAILDASEVKENYQLLHSLVRTSKKGNYSVFTLLQALYKHEKTLTEAFKVTVKDVTKAKVKLDKAAAAKAAKAAAKA